jgi:predicted nucleic-acid-binding Zn-ribbon protein
MPWPFRNRGMVERTCLNCGQIWVLKAAMAGRKPPRAPRVSVATDMRYAQTRSPFTKAGTDQFLDSTHLHDADVEDEDTKLFRQLQVCPKCSSSRYTQRRIRGQGDTAAPGASRAP